MKASLKPLSDLLHPLAHLPWRESSESLVDSGALRLSVYPSLVTICERLVAAEEPSFINVVQSFVRPATNYQEAPEEATASRIAQVRNSLLQYLPLISYAIAPKPVDEPSCWAYNPTHALLESGKREQWDHFEAPAIFFTEDLDALWRKATSEEDKTAVLFKGLEVVLHEWAHGLVRHLFGGETPTKFRGSVRSKAVGSRGEGGEVQSEYLFGGKFELAQASSGIFLVGGLLGAPLRDVVILPKLLAPRLLAWFELDGSQSYRPLVSYEICVSAFSANFKAAFPDFDPTKHSFSPLVEVSASPSFSPSTPMAKIGSRHPRTPSSPSARAPQQKTPVDQHLEQSAADGAVDGVSNEGELGATSVDQNAEQLAKVPYFSLICDGPDKW